MHFATPQFAYFLLVVVTVGWLTRRALTVHKLFLLAASYYFYDRLDLAVVLLASSLVNFGAARMLQRPSMSKPLRVFFLVGTATANLSLLGFFKYYGLFRQSANLAASALGLEAHLPLLELAVPVGISFFTFQGLSYVFDSYRREEKEPVPLLDFLLFIAFFPKLLSGPLCRAKDLLPQLRRGPEPKVDVAHAMARIASGLFKKAVLATFLGNRLVDAAFLAPENHSAPSLLLAAYAYSVQLYCDFSGYSDIAVGVAALLGYRLPENFRAPYAATDPGDFWRRWHMTFSSWLRDYVYFPLGGSRHGTARTLFNLMVTFTLCGLWHGASAGFILWGAFHGLVLCVHKLVRDARRRFGWQGREFAWAAAGWFLTFHAVVFSRIIFKAADLETARAFAQRMLSFTDEGVAFSAGVAVACLLGMSLHFVGGKITRAFVVAHRWVPAPALPLLWISVFAVVLALKPHGLAPYIYFSF